MTIQIINGQNLNLLGKREPDIYGSTDFESYLKSLRLWYSEIDIKYFQSNQEGAIIDIIHQNGFAGAGIILNAGAFTHYSYAIADAVAAVSVPVVEVHISNVYAREAHRLHSCIAPHCAGVIAGLGLSVYRLAVDYLKNR